MEAAAAVQLTRQELTRILTPREQSVLVMLMRNGTGDDARAYIARTLKLDVDEVNGYERDARRKIEEAKSRKLARQLAEGDGPRPVEEAAWDAAGVGDDEEEETVGDWISGSTKDAEEELPTPGNRARRVVELLRERGPMRQADVGRAVGLAGAMWPPVRELFDEVGIVVSDEVIDRSPVLRLHEHDETSGPAGTAAGLPSADAADDADDEADSGSDAPVGPEDELGEGDYRTRSGEPVHDGDHVTPRDPDDVSPEGVDVSRSVEVLGGTWLCGKCGGAMVAGDSVWIIDGKPEHGVGGCPEAGAAQEAAEPVLDDEGDGEAPVEAAAPDEERFGAEDNGHVPVGAIVGPEPEADEKPKPEPEPPPPVWDPISEWVDYFGGLCRLAQANPDRTHLFDRIERMLVEGPPDGAQR